MSITVTPLKPEDVTLTRQPDGSLVVVVGVKPVSAVGTLQHFRNVTPYEHRTGGCWLNEEQPPRAKL